MSSTLRDRREGTRSSLVQLLELITLCLESIESAQNVGFLTRQPRAE
jgi:hypothetical protein